LATTGGGRLWQIKPAQLDGHYRRLLSDTYPILTSTVLMTFSDL